jgi:hypothetical protein
MNLERTLTDDDLRQRAPSIFATAARGDVSEQYQFLPTSSILDGMRDNGWQPVEAREMTVRAANQVQKGFQKHVIRFARTRDLERFQSQLVPGKHVIDRANPLATRMDILVTNSHDRTSAYQLYGAPKRLICFNGLVVSDATMQHLSIRHVGFNPDKVVKASLGLADTIPLVLDVMKCWQDRVLTTAERNELARRALAVRWDSPEKAPIDPGLLLAPRRYEDRGDNLWLVWNRIQENLMKGGIKDHSREYHVSAGGRRIGPSRTRAVKGIDEDLRINRALWDLAEEFHGNN